MTLNSSPGPSASVKQRDLHIYHVATDFIVAKTAEEAKQFYIEMIGETDPVWLEEIEGEVSEVPEDQWDAMKIVDIDEPGHPTHTFREAFNEVLTYEDQEYPKVLATSEY